jgi:hypothetical protein
LSPDTAACTSANGIDLGAYENKRQPKKPF